MIFKKKLHKLKYYYATPTPSENYLNNFYSNIYFKKKTTHTFSKKYSSIELKNKKKRAQHIIDFLLNYVGRKKHLLDIGSGEGFLLKAAKNENFKILGVDYSNFAIKKFNKNILKYFVERAPSEFLEELILNKKKFNIITLQNVLEHVRNPSSLIKSIKKILYKNSYLLVQVPNDFKDLHFLLKKKKYIKDFWFFSPPQHLSYFNFENIKKFFRKNNFKLVDAISDFPIELFLAFKENYVNNHKKKGFESHKARMFFDNYILDLGFKKSSNFYRACNEIGIGRSMILLFKFR